MGYIIKKLYLFAETALKFLFGVTITAAMEDIFIFNFHMFFNYHDYIIMA